MENKTHWKKLEDPNFMGSWSFQPGEEKILTIKDVKRESVYNISKQGNEDCTVVYWEEAEKPFILNKTNGQAIEKAWGSGFIEDWKGHKVKLHVTKVKAFGEVVDAVRIFKDRPTEERIICEKCGKPITPAAGKTAKEISELSMSKFGRKLCIACAKEENNNG